MKVVLWHSRWFDFQNELYAPLQASSLIQNHLFYFPHLDDKNTYNTEEILDTADIFIAEVSYPSTWLWIELWIAKMKGVKIMCLSKKGAQVSSSIQTVSSDFFEYENTWEMLIIFEKILNSYV